MDVWIENWWYCPVDRFRAVHLVRLCELTFFVYTPPKFTFLYTHANVYFLYMHAEWHFFVYARKVAHAKEKKMHIQKNVTRGSYTKKCTSPCVYKKVDIPVCIQKKLTHLRVYKKMKFQNIFEFWFFFQKCLLLTKKVALPRVYTKNSTAVSLYKKWYLSIQKSVTRSLRRTVAYQAGRATRYFCRFWLRSPLRFGRDITIIWP